MEKFNLEVWKSSLRLAIEERDLTQVCMLAWHAYGHSLSYEDVVTHALSVCKLSRAELEVLLEQADGCLIC